MNSECGLSLADYDLKLQLGFVQLACTALLAHGSLIPCLRDRSGDRCDADHTGGK